ncbi:MAG: glycosyltransferase family 2 protein [Lysobacterales bacterium]
MNSLNLVTPVVLTFNEASNIERTLSALRWANRVVVLDSDSSDETPAIARKFANVDFCEHPYKSHADKCNHALDHLVADCPWVLFMDADYVVTDELRQELAELSPTADVSGYWIPFRYCVDGTPLRGTLYPPRICLFRPEKGRFDQFGHTQLLQLKGLIGHLRSPMLHDDRKPSSEFAQRQKRYAELEATYLLSQPWRSLSWPKRLRRLLVIAPWAAPAFALLYRGVILDGLPGLKYAWERAQAEWLIAGALFRQMLTIRTKSAE